MQKLWRIFTKSCISFWSFAIVFLVPTANTKVSMSSSFSVTLICYGQRDVSETMTVHSPVHLYFVFHFTLT